jgi:hypothetical protein
MRAAYRAAMWRRHSGYLICPPRPSQLPQHTVETERLGGPEIDDKQRIIGRLAALVFRKSAIRNCQMTAAVDRDV